MSDRAELRNPLYRNWVRATLGLKYLQQGLAGFVSNLSDQRHQSHLYSYRKVTGSPAHSCTECTADNLLPEHPRKTCIQRYRCKCFCNSPAGRRSCPNNFCSRFYDLIVLDHDERNPVWTNTDPSCWYSEHWSFARCFLATAGYSDKRSAEDTDAAGLLSILINNIEFRSSLDNVSDFVELKKDDIFISTVDAEELRRNAMQAISEKKDESLAEIDQKTFESLERMREIQKAETVKDTNTQTEDTLTHTNTDTSTKNVKNAEPYCVSAVTDSKTLSDLEKQELQSYLIDMYRKNYLKTDLSPLVPEEEVDVDKLYVPLKITRRIGNTLEIEHVCSINDIFYCKTKQAKCIYMSGDAGIGKTTLCRKLISEWCFIHACSPNGSPHIEVGEDIVEENICKLNYTDASQDTLNENSCSVIPKEVLGQKTYDSDDEIYYLFDSDADQSDIEYSSESSDGVGNSNISSNQTLRENDEGKLKKMALRQFELLLFISLRDTYKERTIEEMVNTQLLRKRKLQEYFNVFIDNDPEKCLFILDGLDEWIPPSPLPTYPTVTRGLPVSFGEGRFTILFTSRPWKLELLRPKLGEYDLDVTIHGIEGSDIKHLVKLIFDQIISNKDDVEMKTVMFQYELKKRHIECLCKVPLLTKLLVCLWEKDNELADTVTGIYSSVISKLCSVAHRQNDGSDIIQSLMSQLDKIKVSLPPCLNQYCVCRKFSTLINALGKLSFETLYKAGSKTTFVFIDTDLINHGISEAEYELSLRIGLLSKKRIIGIKKMSPVRCVSFIHKTFQEYFAAAYISMNFEQDVTIQEKLRHSFRSTNNILDVLNVLDFIKSMNPSIICRLTKNTEMNEEKFSLSIKTNILTLKAELNNNTKMIAELLMSNQIHSILVHSSKLGIHSLRFPMMENLDVIEFDSVEMTHSSFREMLESIPESPRGVSVKFRNIAFKKAFSRKKECSVLITCKTLRSVAICFMNICGLKILFSESAIMLEWVKFHMVTVYETEVLEMLNSIQKTNREVTMTFDEMSLGNTVREDKNIFIKILEKCSNVIEFPLNLNAKHLKSVSFLCSDNIFICKNIRVDEMEGKQDHILRHLKNKIEMHDCATIVSQNAWKFNDPGFAIVGLSYDAQCIHSLQLGNITVKDSVLCELLSESTFRDLSSLQLDSIVINETTCQKKKLSLDCPYLKLRKVDLCDIPLFLYCIGISSVYLVNITTAKEDFFNFLNGLGTYSLKYLEIDNISLINRLAICRRTSNKGRLMEYDVERDLTLRSMSYHLNVVNICLKHIIMAENDLSAMLEYFKYSYIYKLVLDNVVAKETSELCGQLGGTNVQNLLLTDTTLKSICILTVQELCLSDISLTDEAFQYLLSGMETTTLKLDKIIIRNTSPSETIIECKGLTNLVIERTDLVSILIYSFGTLETLRLADVSVTENAFCALLENGGKIGSMMLDKVTITNTSVSERLANNRGIGDLRIARTDLFNILMASRYEFKTVCISDITMTENAFCALLENDGYINSMMFDKVTITNTSVTERLVNYRGIGDLRIVRTDLFNILMTSRYEFKTVYISDITMTENAFCTLLENDGYINSMMLDKVTITNTSVTERLVNYRGIGDLRIVRTDLFNILMASRYEFKTVCISDITMTENAFCVFLGSLTERGFKKFNSVLLDNITLTSISTSRRNISLESVCILKIKRMFLSNIVIEFSLENCRHFTDILLEDITMPEASLRDMFDSLSTGLLIVKSVFPGESLSAPSEHIGYKTIKQMVVMRKSKQ
ncbi:uncharacterized protein LOC123532160 isoform X2 [Mercenaria mercenaria]|uniref:uncharacterized protein LOC123532160 isoform X2 n=1 Tax=Mercenaria mercenaria TaxID=6596 RepID=UPI00234EC6A2|nr:uncharacterized protein LOC123532160 isoform X2 [Mercenaria mercenaria]